MLLSEDNCEQKSIEINSISIAMYMTYTTSTVESAFAG